MSVTIPENVKDLLNRPIVVAVATVNPDGQPQVTPVWASLEGDQVWINSAVGRRKDRNLARKSHGDSCWRSTPRTRLIGRRSVVKWSPLMSQRRRWRISTSFRACTLAMRIIYSFNPEGKGNEQRVIYKIEPGKINS